MRPLIKLLVVCWLAVQTSAAWASYSSGKEKFNAGKYAAAAKDFEAAAKDGNPYAKFMLGKMLINGQGVVRDSKRGVDLISDVFDSFDEEIKQLRKDLLTQTAELSALKAEKEKASATHVRVGQQLCRSGTFMYSYQPMACNGGRCVYANQVLQDSAPDGQLAGTIESTSADGARIQIRITGWSSRQMKRIESERHLTNFPMLDGMVSSQLGNVTWDNDYNWVPCK
jgi:hypothetical protein